MSQPDKQWDVFISHASEDKEAFVRPLAASLARLGVKVWYDEFSLRVGDSLSRSIDRGLAESRYGIVVVSPHFIAKPWTDYEFRGLIALEIERGRVILPIWHSVNRTQVSAFSPTLADKQALRTDRATAETIAIQLLREIRPDLYEKHPRSELEQLASGEAFVQLQQELERAHDALAEFQCPFCAAPVTDRGGHWVGSEHYGLFEVFECGYAAEDGMMTRPCPSDPRFPSIDDYELHFGEDAEESDVRWHCHARPKTEIARSVSLGVAYGRTKAEAEQSVVEQYERFARRHSR